MARSRVTLQVLRITLGTAQTAQDGGGHLQIDEPDLSRVNPLSQDKAADVLGPRYLGALVQVVRFSSQPVRWALGTAFACAGAGETLQQSQQLGRLAERFAGFAYKLLDYVGDDHSEWALVGQLEHGLDGGALEMAFESRDIQFTSHPKCEEFIAQLWSSSWIKLTALLTEEQERELPHRCRPSTPCCQSAPCR